MARFVELLIPINVMKCRNQFIQQTQTRKPACKISKELKHIAKLTATSHDLFRSNSSNNTTSTKPKFVVLANQPLPSMHGNSIFEYSFKRTYITILVLLGFWIPLLQKQKKYYNITWKDDIHDKTCSIIYDIF